MLGASVSPSAGSVTPAPRAGSALWSASTLGVSRPGPPGAGVCVLFPSLLWLPLWPTCGLCLSTSFPQAPGGVPGLVPQG